MQDIPPNAKYDWFDNDTFEDWFIKVFLPVAKTKEITALISINLSSHFSECLVVMQKVQCQVHLSATQLKQKKLSPSMLLSLDP